MEESIFTKIIKGEIPCHKIYEDDKTLAFMDIHPVNEGHVLVIPKNQIEFVWDLPDEDYQALAATTKKVALRLRELLPYTYVHQRIIGTDVPHAHVHLIPFDTTSQLNTPQRMDIEPDHATLSELATLLSF